MCLYEIEIILWEDGVRQNYDVYKYLEPIPNEIHSGYKKYDETMYADKSK